MRGQLKIRRRNAITLNVSDDELDDTISPNFQLGSRIHFLSKISAR